MIRECWWNLKLEQGLVIQMIKLLVVNEDHDLFENMKLRPEVFEL